MSPSQGVRETFLKVKNKVLLVEIKSDCDKIINTINYIDITVFPAILANIFI